jgi:hypothetical protein
MSNVVVKLPSGAQIEIEEEAMNLIASNPYKFPKPIELPSSIAVKDENDPTKTKSLPGVKFTISFDYIFKYCVGALSKLFLSNVETTHRKYNPASKEPIDGIPCGKATVSRTVFISFWCIECSLTCLRPQITYNDAKLIFDEITEFTNYFSFEITKVSIKPKTHNTSSLPAGTSRKELERNMNKSRPA